ncbi:TetR/AcrR family transcriptional regulator [Bradyrhizobium sp. LHD-71]|uniref:TetR/AcrR family transcriptional regulator n=1 Tax=Bradyrhizobium sp. LHD-71 TaxID=3072141 RepID=UPI00281067E1|nr:TetR/AcrR family transcriptional regulator [Bradyrhizobium sp. LHD-71]MDQ8732764.1 TetR/AcrR family transcriptional regulator [Bradyrhizobium sp. LHD-71]
MRKSPTQARATQTVDAILEAATQILQSDGEERLTTNRIAERAGVSIGSLYQYFADKEAIVEAIAERERSKIVATIVKSLSEVEAADSESAVREVVRTLVGAFARRRRARRIVVMMMLRRWQNAPDKGADEVAQFLVSAAARGKSANARVMTPVAAFVLTRAMVGAIRAAVLENSPYLESQEFEDELVRLAILFEKN